MKPRTLSSEEEAKLSRSNKKVKDSYHAEFNEGSSDGSPSRSNQSHWNRETRPSGTSSWVKSLERLLKHSILPITWMQLVTPKMMMRMSTNSAIVWWPSSSLKTPRSTYVSAGARQSLWNWWGGQWPSLTCRASWINFGNQKIGWTLWTWVMVSF